MSYTGRGGSLKRCTLLSPTVHASPRARDVLRKSGRVTRSDRANFAVVSTAASAEQVTLT